MAVRTIAEVTVTDETDIDHLVTWYLRSTSPTKPSAPQDGSAPPSPWTSSEPGYDSSLGTTYLYTVTQTVWGDGSLTYGDVQLSSAYEAAKAAYNEASSVRTYATTEFRRTDEAIALRATKTEASQMAQPNLAPLFSMDHDDVYDATTNPDGYWRSSLTAYGFTMLKDGWSHFECDNTAGTGQLQRYIRPARVPYIVPGNPYTILLEIRNNAPTGTGNHDIYLQQINNNQFWGNVTGDYIDDEHETTTTMVDLLSCGTSFVRRSYRLADSAHLTDESGFLFTYNVRTAVGASNSFDLRMSIYEGIYDGPYKPYAGSVLYTTNSELRVTADGINTEVSKKVNGTEVISAINQSAETVKIQASKVEITGDAVFSAINDDTGTTKISGGKIDTTSITIGQSQVTDLTTDLAAKATPADITTAIGAIEIGGRNLLRGTENQVTESYAKTRATVTDGILRLTPTTSYARAKWIVDYLDYSDFGSGTYTASFDVRLADVESAYTIVKLYIYYGFSSASRVTSAFSSSYDRYSSKLAADQLTNDWTRVSITFDVSEMTTGQASALVAGSQLSIEPYVDGSNMPVDIRRLKLERGTKATDWTPAPEDVDASITAVQDDLDKSKDWYGTCSTAAGTAAKVVVCDGFTVGDGVRLTVRCSTASSANVTTLTVQDSSGNELMPATTVHYNAGAASSSNPIRYGVNAVLHFVYDGTVWVLDEKPPSYSTTCSTAAGTRDKAASAGGALLVNGTRVTIRFSTANTYKAASVRLNFASTGAIGIYSDNVATSASHNFLWDANTVLTFTQQGTIWHLADNGTRTMSENAAKTATNYISIDPMNGIRIADADPDTATTYQHQTATETEFVVGGVSRAAISGDGARFGATDESHQLLDYHSMQLVDKNGDVYFHVSDLRGTDGYAIIVESFTVQSTRTFVLGLTASEITSVKVDGATVEYTSQTTSTVTRVTLATQPSSGAVVLIEYKTADYRAKAYTIGLRAAGSDIGAFSVAIGLDSTASGRYSHSEGWSTTASNDACHSEGMSTVASGLYSHAEGYASQATGGVLQVGTAFFTAPSHAEGYDTTASNGAAHAEGGSTVASGGASHAEGLETTASGDSSHAEGSFTNAVGNHSHAQNFYTTAAYDNQTAIGKYNDNQSTSAFEIGNGTRDSARSNAFAVDWSGNVVAAGGITLGTPIDSSQLDTVARDKGGTGVTGMQTGTMTLNTTNCTLNTNYNMAWHNGVVATVQLGMFTLNSALANGSTVVVGTVPSGYRPVGRIYANVACALAGVTGLLVAYIGSNGTISLVNRSGASLSTSVGIIVTATYAI